MQRTIRFGLLLGISMIWALTVFAGASAGARYVDNGNGTVTDARTGLVWQQSDDGQYRNWQNALGYCEGLSLGGHSDWKLPNIRELRSIVDFSRYYPAIDPVFSCRSGLYWSSSTYANYPTIAWSVDFYDGYVDAYGKTTSSFDVRCVRGGPSGSFGSLIIAQTPMSGPPGTAFVQWGTGFSPNSTAELHFQKPDGTEYPTASQPIDSNGNFEINYTAPLNKPPGTYKWWGIDGVTKGKSNEVSYVIEGVMGQLHHFDFSSNGQIIHTQTVDALFDITIQAKDYAGNLVTSFNDTVSLSLASSGQINPNEVSLSGGQCTFKASVSEPSWNARIHCQFGAVSSDSNEFGIVDLSPTTGGIEGSVVDTDGSTRLSGAKVTLGGLPFGPAKSTTFTDQSGIFTFQNIDPGRYYIWASYGTKGSMSQLWDVGRNKSYPPTLKVRSKKRPVILVAGIMGSTDSSASLFPTLSSEWPEPRGKLKLYNVYYLFSEVVGWHALRNLLDDHYQTFDCPYDWRVSLQDQENTIKKYLIPVIEEAKNQSGWEKVDIVAHSMGGLIVRDYIQSDDYKGDVDKFAMVGTPNHGSLNPYYVWEGGDPMLIDRETGALFEDWSYSNISNNVYPSK